MTGVKVSDAFVIKMLKL